MSKNKNIVITGALGQDGIILSRRLIKKKFNIFGIIKKINSKKINKVKYKISEIPIYLPGRLVGKSKMKFSDILDALLYLFKIYFKSRT